MTRGKTNDDSLNPVAEPSAKRRKVAKGICHLCRAGQEDVPWEDYFSRCPVWLGTMHEENAFKEAPALSRLLHPPGEVAGIFSYDLFHTIHLGTAKIHVSSCLGLISDWMPGRSLVARFEVLNVEFKTWCKSNGESPAMGKLTPSFIGWPKHSKTDYPVGSWYKGSVTTVLMRFLQWKLESMNASQDPILKLALEATTALNQALTTLYQQDLFLEPIQSELIGNLGLRFLRKFALLSKSCDNVGKRLWCIIPKLHVQHHLFLTLLLQSQQNKLALNPLAVATQQDEDYVGRPSRLSRRVDPRQAPARVLKRLLKASYAEYVKAKFIHGS